MANARATGGIALGYDSVAQALHWLIAALAIAVVLLGWTIEGIPRNTPQRDLAIMVHSSVGLSILTAMVFRAGWRWRHPPPPSLRHFEAALARANHLVLYLIFILMPLAGYLNAAAAGRLLIFSGSFLSRRYCRKTDVCRRWQSRFVLSGNIRFACS
jgi:cytochrome b561